jgi:ATP-dependent DNA helicase RecG
MSVTLQQLQQWMDSKEDEHLEFKTASNNFHFDKLVKYCAAIANENGGRIIFGITDKRPRRVVGSQAFGELERTKAGLIDRLRLRVEVDEVSHPNGRVLVFHVPPRPIGMPIQIEGAYWMRGGEDLAPMTADMLQRIFAEAGPDFSAEVSPTASIDDIDPAAIEDFRRRWIVQSGNRKLARLPVKQLLADAELAVGDSVTYAALVLLGKRTSLGRLLARAEVIFEYRSSEAVGPANQRISFREGFLLFYDQLWETINLRNDVQSIQDRFAIAGIPTFSEGAVREAILNAISHRDYRLEGSVFIRQYPRRIEIVSPGGFPVGVTPQNIIDRQLPRNRRIAEAFEKCDFVERSGQGANRMFEESIRQSKPLPNFAGTDAFQVALTLDGTVRDPAFLRFLDAVGEENTATFTTHDWLVLALVAHGDKVPRELRDRLPRLMELGVIERIGPRRYMPAHRFFAFLGDRAAYTRRRGLDRQHNLQLLKRHLRDNASTGSPFRELVEVIPSLGEDGIRSLLRTLARTGQAHFRGQTRAAFWFPGANPDLAANQMSPNVIKSSRNRQGVSKRK